MEQNSWTHVRTEETECSEQSCRNEKYDDIADSRRGYPWPWDQSYPYKGYKSKEDKDKKVIQSDPRYGSVKPRVYEASLWVRKDEQIRFHVKFSKGSHMKFTWMLSTDEVMPPPRNLPKYSLNATNSNPHVKFEDERCEITKAPQKVDMFRERVELQTYRDESNSVKNTTFASTGRGNESDLCEFPFRFESVLYYACTYLVNNSVSSGIGSPAEPAHLCATATDTDFNPVRMGFCAVNFQCPLQLARPEDVGLATKEDALQTVTEGDTVFSRSFIKPVETEIVLDRKFSAPGHTYNLTLVSYNMHDIISPNILMKWTILCANPVKPEHWDLVYKDGIHFGETFELQFKVQADAPLPTRPLIRVFAVTSLPEEPPKGAEPRERVSKGSGMRRWDNAPFISQQTPQFTIPFYVKHEIETNTEEVKKARALWQLPNRLRKYWWEPLRVERNQDMPPEMLMHDQYELHLLGVENYEESQGLMPHDGTSSTTNLMSRSNTTGIIGSGEGLADYTDLTLCFPTIKYPGSYGFTVAMWNGISNIRYAFDRNLSNPVYYPENVTLLLPGGEGYQHSTGKTDDHCLQSESGEKLLDEFGEELCQSGNSLEVEVSPGSFTATVFPWTEPGKLNFNGSYKWMLNWVEVYETLTGPNEAELKYVLPEEAPNDKPHLDFVKPKYYLPAQAHPVFKLSLYKGTPRKIAYKFNNTRKDGYNPPDLCFVDWPPENLMPPCFWKSCPDQEDDYAAFSPRLSWDIEHCGNISEDTYNVQIGAWNPLDGWLWMQKPFTVEVLETIGPIIIDDFNIINDAGEIKHFNIRLGRMGQKTCITLDWNDGSKLQFLGNAMSCKLRFENITENDVMAVDSVAKNFDIFHIYEVRGIYKLEVTGFDERSFDQEVLDVTIFRIACKVPQVWLPINQTSWKRSELVPKVLISKPHKVVSMSSIECNQTVETIMEWAAYTVKIKNDPNSQNGLIEQLTEISLNETVPSYRSSLIDIPPLTLSLGLHKLEFKFEIDTGVPEFPLYKKAYTYFKVTKTPLVPGFIKGSVAKVTRGWGQLLKLDAAKFSTDPDNPGDRNFNFTWWCRRVDSNPPEEFDELEYLDTDFDGVEEKFPVWKEEDQQRIPGHKDPILVDPPPGCFGNGPGSMKVSGPRLTLNTSSFVTYAQVYEVSMIVSKDERVAQVKVEVDIGVLPVPLVEIDCASPGLCFPTFGGIFVNPTIRLAMRSSCSGGCEVGDITYNWTLQYPHWMTVNTIFCDNDMTTSTSTTLSPTTMETLATAPHDTGSSFVLQNLPIGCTSVFTAGVNTKEFTLTADFFAMNPELTQFDISLNITRCLTDSRGRRLCSSGISLLGIQVNDPPYQGTCAIFNLGQNEGENSTNPGRNTALLDVFQIKCKNWDDPNQHAITKYVFKAVEMTPRGNETRLLYAGPLANTKAVLGVGIFNLRAQIWDEAGAFTDFDIDGNFTTVLPTQSQYESYEIQADIKKFADTGDASRIAMILQADSSLRSLATWLSLDNLEGEKPRHQMTDREADNYDSLLRDLTNANTLLVSNAASALPFNNLDDLEQGAGTLYSITSQLMKGGAAAKTLDMKGRDASLTLINKMNEGFKKMPVSDPSQLKEFIESTTGSILSILSGLNNILYNNNADDISITDIEAAASLPYDTDIPEGDADIPEDPRDALRANALKVTRIEAVSQVKTMVGLVDDIAATALKSMVAGEILKTSSPLGVSMTMAKISGAFTIGKDINGDGLPDVPLAYDIGERSRVEFPLNFCPGVRFDWLEGEGENRTLRTCWHLSPDPVLFPCVGVWGIALKEWQVIKQTYPPSARNLNRLTMTVDVDIYDEMSQKVTIKDVPAGFPIMVTTYRMKNKDRGSGALAMPESASVNVVARLKLNKRRRRLPIIHHRIPVNRTYATINVQLKGHNPLSRLVIMAKHGQMMMAGDCDFVQLVNEVTSRDGQWVDWFIGVDKVKNKTGDWYFGIAALAVNPPQSVKNENSCEELSKTDFSDNFNMSSYSIRMFTGGCYTFNETTEEWDGRGISVEPGGDNVWSTCSSSHLSSFGTGFFPQKSFVNFDFIFAETDLTDNVTLYSLLLVTILVFFITVIWSYLTDKKDIETLKPHWMKDNQPENLYMYEIVVQTGPMLSHGTTSKVQLTIGGDDSDTGVRTLSHPSKKFFKKGAMDTFLMTTAEPLGDPTYLKIWHDNSGLREMQPWFLSYVILQDLQTGEKCRFIADCWLAIDRDQHSSEIIIPVSSMDSPASKGFLMRTGFFKKLQDDHIFWSIFSRPVRSRLTRTQRTCICLASFSMTMLINVIW